ncbi:MAG: hypothetical protein C4522_08795 [Desulfobacteraceae bacterium]|nr:MAG: hypothetical protein C4522_08795 [Desulfobacteraceae bacterium]
MKAMITLVCSLLLVFGGLGAAQAGSVNTLVISEVLYDPAGGDDQREWIELFNGTAGVIDLAEWSIGWGGSAYSYGTLQLDGTIDPAAYFIVGGPTSDLSNSSPSYSLAFDISPDLQNSGTIADGIALFHTLASSITNTTVPFFSVIYGGANSSSLIDHTGSVGAVDVGDAPSGQSIEFLGDGWVINPSPNPGSGSLSTVPVPSAIWMLASGLFGLVGIKRKSKTE